jgi:hypothetical protein
MNVPKDKLVLASGFSSTTLISSFARYLASIMFITNGKVPLTNTHTSERLGFMASDITRFLRCNYSCIITVMDTLSILMNNFSLLLSFNGDEIS